jgi:thioredoxin-dependent peroxiredoxin
LIGENSVAETQLQIGDLAPDFELPADDGSTISLSQFRGRRVIVYFYPKDNTSGCTAQACGFRDHYTDIEERDAVVLGVSPDGVKSHQKFRTKHDLPFLLLADEDHSVAESYGVWQEKSMYGKKYYGVVRSHFLVDEEGRLADIQMKVSPAESVERALASLQASGA